MSDDGDAQDEKFANDPTGDDFTGFAVSREEYIFGDEDDEDPAESPRDGRQQCEEASLTQLNDYPTDVDYYAILGLPKDPPPSDDSIRSAFRLLSLSFHPDKHPRSEQKAQQAFQRLETAYEVLIDPQKRVVYDMLGAEGVTREWDDNRGGGLGLNHSTMVGVRAMDAEEFKEWFLGKMRKRERRVLERMIGNRTHLTVGLNALTVFPPNGGFLAYTLRWPQLQYSSFNVRSTFNLPLPSHTNATCKINAGIGGQLKRILGEIEYETEAGENETKSYLMPVSMFTRSVTLGVNGSYKIPGNAAVSILQLLNGCEVDAGISVLPSSVLRTAISRSFKPLKGARPLTLQIQTICHKNPLHIPPTVDVSISRQLGQRQYADVSWSSGMWFWPSALQDALGQTLGLGLDNNEPVFMTGYSSCRMSFTSYPAFDQPASETPEDPSKGSGDHRRSAPPTDYPSPVSEGWAFELASSPFGGALSVSYGRNLFRGQVRKPAQSEWSHVGHQKTQRLPTESPQAVRMDLEGSISTDGTIGWMMQGSRAVGDFSRIGVAVGVQGPKGLVLSISWNRLGQSLNVPILVCPLDLVNADIIAASIAIPWTIYAAFQYGVIRPKGRHQYRIALLQKRKELEELMHERQAESERTIELMAARVERSQAVEEEIGGLVILEARYGVSRQSRVRPGQKSSAEPRPIDVTVPVAGLVHKGQLSIARGVNKTQILGFYDPAPLKSKSLHVRYMFAGQEHFVEVQDDEALLCPRDSHRM